MSTVRPQLRVRHGSYAPFTSLLASTNPHAGAVVTARSSETRRKIAREHCSSACETLVLVPLEGRVATAYSCNLPINGRLATKHPRHQVYPETRALKGSKSQSTGRSSKTLTTPHDILHVLIWPSTILASHIYTGSQSRQTSHGTPSRHSIHGFSIFCYPLDLQGLARR